MPLTLSKSYNPKRELNGVDVYMYNTELSPEELGKRLEELAGPEFKLTVISNRGVKVYPDGFPETFLSDNWRCRFEAREPGTATRAGIRALLERLEKRAWSGSSWTTSTSSTASWPTRWIKASNRRAAAGSRTRGGVMRARGPMAALAGRRPGLVSCPPAAAPAPQSA